MKNIGIMALVIGLLILVALAWNPPATITKEEIKSSYPEVPTILNVSRNKTKPTSGAESLTSSATLIRGMPIAEHSGPNSGVYLSLGILKRILKVLQDLLNQVLAFLGRGLNVSINQSSKKEGSASSQYLGITIVFITTVLVVISYYFGVRRRSRQAIIHARRKRIGEELRKSVDGGEDPVTEAIIALAYKASKDLKKPPEVVTHRECGIVTRKVDEGKIKEEIIELIRDYELIRFAGKPVNKDLRTLAFKVLNAIRGV